MFDQPSTSTLASANPEKKRKTHEQKIELHRIRFRDPYYKVYREMISDPDRQEYGFYEIPEAATLTDGILKHRGIKVDLLGIYGYNLKRNCHYLLSQDTLDKTFDNPLKVYLKFGREKDLPVPEDVIEVKGILKCKNWKHFVEVHIVNTINEHVVDEYLDCLRRLKREAADVPSDLDLQDFLREIESCPMLS